MKINPDQIFDHNAAVVENLGPILLFGPNQGLVSEIVARCIADIAGKPADPFMLSEFNSAQLKADPACLSDEVCALPMLGERKIIVVRQATDSIASVLETALAVPINSNVLLIEASELSPRSRIRRMFEKDKYAAAVGCYEDNLNKIHAIITEVMKKRHIKIDPDTVSELATRLGNDRMVTRSEVEKLALYAGEGGQITINDIIAVIGDSSATSLEDLVFSITDGKIDLTDQLFVRAVEDGISPIQILRALQVHLQRLHAVIAEIQNGMPSNSAVEQLRPPVFFKVKSRFQQQCKIWSIHKTMEAMSFILETERKCKKTGAPITTICHRAVLRLVLIAHKQGHHHRKRPSNDSSSSKDL